MINMPEKTIEIPDGVEARFEKNSLIVRGPKGELQRIFKSPWIKKEIKENTIIFSSGSERRKTCALLGTWASHARNMIIGVTRGWEAKLKTVYSHFPVKINIEGDKVIIQNFMGERKPRVSSIVGDTKVNIGKDEIVITGTNKEDVGQTAANIELVTKVSGYDRRVFQDGCHLIQKCSPVDEEKGE